MMNITKRMGKGMGNMAELSSHVLGERLKTARKNAGLTQKQVADYLGVSVPQISYWENGQREIDLSSLSKLADLYGYSLSWFLGSDISTEVPVSISYRTEALSEADLKIVAWANRFVRNLELLKRLVEGHHE